MEKILRKKEKCKNWVNSHVKMAKSLKDFSRLNEIDDLDLKSYESIEKKI
jgi:hypothetical protein